MRTKVLLTAADAQQDRCCSSSWQVPVLRRHENMGQERRTPGTGAALCAQSRAARVRSCCTRRRRPATRAAHPALRETLAAGRNRLPSAPAPALTLALNRARGTGSSARARGESARQARRARAAAAGAGQCQGWGWSRGAPATPPRCSRPAKTWRGGGPRPSRAHMPHCPRAWPQAFGGSSSPCSSECNAFYFKKQVSTRSNDASKHSMVACP